MHLKLFISRYAYYVDVITVVAQDTCLSRFNVTSVKFLRNAPNVYKQMHIIVMMMKAHWFILYIYYSEENVFPKY